MLINWKSHKAALTGGSRYLIKGVISVVHSVTSVVPFTADCIFPLSGPIDSGTTALTGSIDSASTALTGAILTNLAITGQITQTLALSGPIDANTTALTGSIDSAPTTLTGTITETLALTAGSLCTI